MCGIVTNQRHADREYQNVLLFTQHFYCAIQVGSFSILREDAALEGLLEISSFTWLSSPKLYRSGDNSPKFVVEILRWGPWHPSKELNIYQEMI